MRVLFQALLEDGSADGFALLAALDRFCLGLGMSAALRLRCFKRSPTHLAVQGCTPSSPATSSTKYCMNMARLGAASPPRSREAQGRGQILPHASCGKCIEGGHFCWARQVTSACASAAQSFRAWRCGMLLCVLRRVLRSSCEDPGQFIAVLTRLSYSLPQMPTRGLCHSILTHSPVFDGSHLVVV